MRLSLAVTLGVAFHACACTKGSEEAGPATPAMGWIVWPKKEDAFISTLQKRQDANLVRLSQQRAIEQAAAAQAEAELAAAERASKKKKSSRSRKVPPSMYRTTEPPLPEPDLSLPIQEIPRSSPR